MLARDKRLDGRPRIKRWKRNSQSSIQVLRLQVETALRSADDSALRASYRIGLHGKLGVWQGPRDSLQQVAWFEM
jgi:hypothetical protein